MFLSSFLKDFFMVLEEIWSQRSPSVVTGSDKGTGQKQSLYTQISALTREGSPVITAYGE